MYIYALANKNLFRPKIWGIWRKKMTDDFIMVAINNIDFN